MKTTRIVLVSFLTNLFLIFFKLIFGIIGSSTALIADSMHSFSDVISDVFAYLGVHISNKKEDITHPYGYGKLEYLISLLMGSIILFLGINIIKNSINRKIIVPSLFVALVSFITMIIKLLVSKYIIKNGKKLKNNILISSGYESRSDVISSSIVFLSIIIMNLSNKVYIFKYADLVATILVGLIIIKMGVKIIINNISTLLDEQELDSDIIEKIENIFYSEDKIYKIDNLVIIKFGPYSNVTAKVSMDETLSLTDAHNKIISIKDRIMNIYKIKNCIIEIKPYIEK